MVDYPLLPKQMPKQIKSVWRKSQLLGVSIFLVVGIAITAFLIWLEALEGFWFWSVIIYFVFFHFMAEHHIDFDSLSLQILPL